MVFEWYAAQVIDNLIKTLVNLEYLTILTNMLKIEQRTVQQQDQNTGESSPESK